MWDDTKRFFLDDLRNSHKKDLFCESLTVGDNNDWRIPTLDELKNLYKNKKQLKNDKIFIVWSSKEVVYPSYEKEYYLLNFKNGKVERTFDSMIGHTVKCVRSID